MKLKKTVALPIASTTKAAETPDDYLAMVDVDKRTALNKFRKAIRPRHPTRKSV